MRMKVKILMLTLITMVTSIAFSSCSKDEEPKSVDDYYLVLSSVNTNLVDATTGQSMALVLLEEANNELGLDSKGEYFFGQTTKESAVNAFNGSVENFRKAYNEAYAGKNLLPEGGFIDYEFILKNKSGETFDKATIRVTNNGAITY